LLAILLATAMLGVCQKTERKIIDVHFHAFAGIALEHHHLPMKLRSRTDSQVDSEEQSSCLCIKKMVSLRHIIRCPDLVTKYIEADDERLSGDSW
jgi:hypothetical protein